MTTVIFDDDGLGAAADRLGSLAQDLSGLRNRLRAEDADLAAPVAHALQSFGRNSGELLGQISAYSQGASEGLRAAQRCYRTMEDTLVAHWTAGAPPTA